MVIVKHQYKNFEHAKKKQEEIKVKTGRNSIILRNKNKKFILVEPKGLKKKEVYAFGKKFDFGRKAELGKGLDFGTSLDFGKPIDLGKELDLGI